MGPDSGGMSSSCWFVSGHYLFYCAVRRRTHNLSTDPALNESLGEGTKKREPKGPLFQSCQSVLSFRHYNHHYVFITRVFLCVCVTICKGIALFAKSCKNRRKNYRKNHTFNISDAFYLHFSCLLGFFLSFIHVFGNNSK